MKRIVSLITGLSLLCSLIFIVPVQAASEIDFGSTVTDSISENNEENKYTFDLYESGKLSVKYIAENIEAANLKIYDEDGQEIWSDRPWWNDTSKQISYRKDVELTSGIYHFYVSKYSGCGDYELTLNFEGSNESFSEAQNGSDNTFKAANEISLNRSYTGQLAENDDIDNYSFTLNNSGGFELYFTAENIEAANLKIYDEDGQEIWSDRPWWNDTSKQISFSKDIELTSGTYYFSVSKYSRCGTYTFEMNFEKSNESFSEAQNGSDNTFKAANEISLNRSYTGQLAENDDIDNYSFTLNNSGGFELYFTAENIEAANLKIYDEDGQEIWSDRPWWNDTSKQISFSKDIELTSGTYYFSVSKYSRCGTYEFKLITGKNITDNTDNDNDVSQNDWTNDNTDNYTYDDTDDNETSFGSYVSDWAKQEVEEAYDNDLIPETIAGRDLTEIVDRSEFAAIAVQLYEELTKRHVLASENPFFDISGNENSDAIIKAYKLGITNGTTDITFEPYSDITREDLATMLCRTIKKYSNSSWTLENDSNYYLDTSGVKKYADDSDISDYAKPSVYYMTKLGIIKGIDSTHFAPKNVTARQEAEGYATATREQAILMSLRIFNISEIL